MSSMFAKPFADGMSAGNHLLPPSTKTDQLWDNRTRSQNVSRTDPRHFGLGGPLDVLQLVCRTTYRESGKGRVGNGGTANIFSNIGTGEGESPPAHGGGVHE